MFIGGLQGFTKLIETCINHTMLVKEIVNTRASTSSQQKWLYCVHKLAKCLPCSSGKATLVLTFEEGEATMMLAGLPSAKLKTLPKLKELVFEHGSGLGEQTIGRCEAAGIRIPQLNQHFDVAKEVIFLNKVITLVAYDTVFGS